MAGRRAKHEGFPLAFAANQRGSCHGPRDTGDMASDRIEAVLRAHGVTVAYLFGSRADTTARPSSDHDIAVLFDRPVSLLDLGHLQAGLVETLATPVDVIELDGATLELRAAVIQQGRLLFSADEPRRVAFETATRSRWFDFRPVQQELTRAYLRRVAAEGQARG